MGRRTLDFPEGTGTGSSEEVQTLHQPTGQIAGNMKFPTGKILIRILNKHTSNMASFERQEGVVVWVFYYSGLLWEAITCSVPKIVIHVYNPIFESENMAIKAEFVEMIGF